MKIMFLSRFDDGLHFPVLSSPKYNFGTFLCHECLFGCQKLIQGVILGLKIICWVMFVANGLLCHALG